MQPAIETAKNRKLMVKNQAEAEQNMMNSNRHDKDTDHLNAVILPCLSAMLPNISEPTEIPIKNTAGIM